MLTEDIFRPGFFFEVDFDGIFIVILAELTEDKSLPGLPYAADEKSFVILVLLPLIQLLCNLSSKYISYLLLHLFNRFSTMCLHLFIKFTPF